MNQQNPSIQTILTTTPAAQTPNQPTPTVQKIQQISGITTSLANATTIVTNPTNKNIQILNPLSSTFSIPQSANVAFTIDNSNIKSSNLKINQMTPPTITLIPTHSINTNPAQNSSTSTSIQNTNQTSSNGSSNQTPTSSTSSSSTSTYGGFAYCSNCGEYGVKAAFYGKSKLYCSVACQNGTKKQQQQQQANHGVKRTIEALNQSPITNNTTQLTSQTTNIIQQVTPVSAAQLNTIQPVISSNIISNIITITTNNPTSDHQVVKETSHNFVQKSGPTTISTLLSQQQQLNSQLSAKVLDGQHLDTNNPVLHSSSVILSPATTHLSSPSYTNSQTSLSGANPPKRARKASNSSVSTSNSSTELNNQQSSTNGSTSTGTPLNLPKTPSITPSVQTITESKLSPPSSSSSKSPAQHLLNSFNWVDYLESNPDSVIAPVNAFKHVPLSNEWLKLIKNLKVEVPNRYSPPENLLVSIPMHKKCFWFASVINIAGYWLKLRYIGYDDDPSADFWVHINDENLKPVGWCADNGYSLTPPMKIAYNVDDWEAYSVEKLVHSRTIPKTLDQKIKDSLVSKFRRGMTLELLDKKKLSQMRVAKIVENMGGRLRLKYENSQEFEDFWCHERSDLIHPVGWSVKVGHEILSTENYKEESSKKYENNDYLSNECNPSMFVKTQIIKNLQNKGRFKKNMKLEAVDPLNLSSICVATVAKVLDDGYLMVEIDGYKSADGNDLFCYHRTSSAIFPAGFCQKQKLPLQPPFNYKKDFSWETYLKETNSEYAPPELFNQDNSHENPFKVGMKLESVDLIEPRLICVATVVAVVNRLIRLNFDGWDTRYDQWVDFESCDIYPVGWCHLVGYRLEEPPKVIEEKKRGRKPKKK